MSDDDRIGRRAALALGVAVAACSRTTKEETPATQREGTTASTSSPRSGRMTALYLPHGGGPWPWMDAGGMFEARESRALTDYLTGIPAQLPQRPKAVVVVSAHWEAPVPTVMTNARPSILYDYYGFPPAMYEIAWPAPGAPAVAARVRELLSAAKIPSAEDPSRGFDHGTFVPLKLTFPGADIPTIQLSLQEGLDPARHIEIGRALAPLRDEGVLIVGSGMSYHNLRELVRHGGGAVSNEFDAWLQRSVLAEPAARVRELVRWASAPSARQAHPREEHLLPLMVIAGAAGDDGARVAYSDTFGGAHITAFHFG
ncbi:MAG: class III extradiol ring-cleavage dioxygenase [Labilithrix sp.]